MQAGGHNPFLSTAGAALIGAADSYSLVVAGRLMSGVGGILLNVIMAKMVMDWFAGKELVLAMAIYMNANPIGIGLAVAILGPIAHASGWRSALFVTAGLSAVCLALMALAYAPHANDRAGTEKKQGSAPSLSWSELGLVGLTSAIYTLYNASYVLILVFAPPFLSSRGSTPEEIGLLLGTFNWIAVADMSPPTAYAARPATRGPQWSAEASLRRNRREPRSDNS